LHEDLPGESGGLEENDVEPFTGEGAGSIATTRAPSDHENLTIRRLRAV